MRKVSKTCVLWRAIVALARRSTSSVDGEETCSSKCATVTLVFCLPMATGKATMLHCSQQCSSMGTLSCLEEWLHGLHPTSVLYLFDDDIWSVLAEHGWNLPSLLVAEQTRFHGQTPISVPFAWRLDANRRWAFCLVGLRRRTSLDVCRRWHVCAVVERSDVDDEWLPGEIDAFSEHEERANESRDEDKEVNSEIVSEEAEETTQFEEAGHPGEHCQ